MHSGLLLFSWLIGVVIVQHLSPLPLAAAVTACLALGAGFARRRTLRLLRRIRILLLAIVVLFAWFTPGEALLHDWPRLGPTREGAWLALVHAARLVAVVCAVALLLERLPMERLISGLYTLVRPFRLLGVQPERLALRLLLVLRYVESSPRDGRPVHWKDWLEDEAGAVEEGGGGERICLLVERFGVWDATAMVGLCMGLFWWVFA